MIKPLLLIILILISNLFLFGQEKSPFHVSGVFGLGPALGQNENMGAEKVNMGIGFGTELNVEFGYRYKDQLSISVGGGLGYYQQSFSNSNLQYDIAYYGTQLRTDIQSLFPLNSNKYSDLSIGCGFGAAFVSDEQRKQLIASYTAITRSYSNIRYFIAPHIGFSQELNGNRLSLSATYKLHLRTDPLYTTTITSPTTDMFSRFRGGYLGIVLKYDWYLNKKERPVPVPEIESVPTEIVDRPTTVEKRIKVSKQIVKIKVWDHSTVDGDTISMQLNNKFILTNYKIKKRKKVLRLELDHGINLLTLMAHNTGTLGENTCTVKIKNDGQQQKFIFKTNETRHETMEIQFDQ